MKTLKIKTEEFIDWYFNSGSDQDADPEYEVYDAHSMGLIGKNFKIEFITNTKNGHSEKV